VCGETFVLPNPVQKYKKLWVIFVSKVGIKLLTGDFGGILTRCVYLARCLMKVDKADEG
jgi:hypothetical protein